MLKKLLASLAALCLLLAMFTSVASAANPFGAKENGEYRIMVIPDAHQDRTTDLNLTYFIESSINYMRQGEDLNLIVFLGDMLSGNACKQEEYITDAIHELLVPVLAADLPFTVVFGQNDYNDLAPEIIAAHGPGQTAVKQWLLSLYAAEAEAAGKAELFLQPDVSFEDGGASNLKLSVLDRSENPFFDLFFFDTGNSLSQVEWYKTNTNPSIPVFMFQNVPLPHIYDNGYFLQAPFSLPFGLTHQVMGRDFFTFPNYFKMAGTVLQAPDPSSEHDELFNAILSNRNLVAAFFGHDHKNSFIERYPAEDGGLDLVQLPAAAWNGADASFLTRGITFVRIFRGSDGKVNYSHDLFTYRQGTRVAGSKVTSSVNGFSDFITVVPYLWRSFLSGTVSLFRVINNRGL